MNMKDGQRHPILSWWNFSVRNRRDGAKGAGGESEESESREADGQKHDLPRSRFKSEDHERRDKGEVAVIVGKGERISVLTTVED